MMKHQNIVYYFLVVLLILSSCKKKNSAQADPSQFDIDTVKARVLSVTELGALSMPSQLAGRDGGQTALIGNKIVWIFGDSFFTSQGEDGQHYRTNTSTQSTIANPIASIEPLDANGVSYQFVPYTTEEKHYNDSANSASNRIALWPTGIIPIGSNKAFVFFTKLLINGDWQDYGIGIAKYTLGDTSCVRNNGLLFQYPEPNFQTTLISDNYLYLYGRLRSNNQVAVARAPLSKVEQRDAYRFWDGADWVSDIGSAKGVTAFSGGSYSYNKYHGLYIHIFDKFANDGLYIQFAQHPEGPWSQTQKIYNTIAPEHDNNYLMVEHPELAKENGKIIYISYHRPLPAFLAGEIRLIEIAFE